MTVPLCILSQLLVFFSLSTAQSRTLYVDPHNGAMENDGSFESPLSTLGEIFAAGSIPPYIMPGDSLVLRDGHHGELNLSNIRNDAFITITAETGHTPALSRLILLGCEKWRIDGVSISPSYQEDFTTNYIVRLSSITMPSHDIYLCNCDIFTVNDATQWSGDDWATASATAVHATGGSTIHIIGNSMHTVFYGIVANGDSIEIRGNSIDGFVDDGINIGGRDILIENNVIKNLYDVSGAHNDGIQIYAGTEDPHENITLRNNMIIQYDPTRSDPWTGDLQGVGCFDGPNVGMHIENNLVIVDHYHGITIYDAVDCRIINNTVADSFTGNATTPSIAIVDDSILSSGCTIRNNLSPGFITKTAVATTFDHNIAVSDPYLVYVDPDTHDYRPRETSGVIDAGSALLAPDTDIEGSVRPQRCAVDIGAYEMPYIQPPVIASVLIFPNSGRLSVGDTIRIVVREKLDRAGLKASMATINSNSVPLYDMTDGTYAGIYVIGADDASGEAVEAHNIILTDDSGRQSQPASSSGSSLSIDTNPVAVGGTPAGAGSFAVFPNPFNSATLIEFTIPPDENRRDTTRVHLALYNLLGQRVTTIVDGGLAAGTYRHTWRGIDEDGCPVSAGIYFLVLIHGAERSVMPLTYLK